MRLPITFHQIGGPNHIFLASYKDWLVKQTIVPNTSRVYYSRIKQFILFLEYASLSDKLHNDPASMNEAMGIYLDFLKESKKGNATINATVNALKNFSCFLGVQDMELKRECCYYRPTKMLTLSEQERFLRSVEKQESARDKALALVLFYTGLRIGDCAHLNMGNIVAGSACIYIDDATRIPLNKKTAFALRQWLEERKKLISDEAESGLWLTKQGQRLSIAGIAFVIERIGWQAQLVISAETLRRTWLAQATDCLDKDELASRFGGYISTATIKRYGITLPVSHQAIAPLER